jgi:hypothetical protein
MTDAFPGVTIGDFKESLSFIVILFLIICSILLIK